MLLLNLDRVCSLRKFLVFSLISSGWALSAMAQQQADPRQIDQQQPTARRNQGEAPQSGQAAQPGQYRLVDAATAVAQGDAQVAQPPFPALSEAEQRYVDQVLDVWEKSTSQINTFECQFKRWIYNPNTHETHPESIAEGSVRYKSPDKGSFKEETRVTLAGTKPDGAPDYKANPRLPFGDWWVCDGEWVHQLDRNDKKAVRTQLPPELRGNNILLSPLPFLFGVKAHEVKSRYYVRAIAPPQGNNDVWIEAWPKRADDAGNYSRVQIVLDRSDNLPRAMFLFMPNWTPEAKHRELYEFSGKQVNSILDRIKQNLFMQSFIDTKVGGDWQVIQEPWIPPQQAEQQPASTGNRVATPGQPAAR